VTITERHDLPAPKLANRLVAALAVGSALFQLAQQQSLGFPDGYISELDRTMRMPHTVLAGLVVVLAGALAFKAGRWRWWLAAILLALCVLDHFGLRWIGIAMGLDHGQGG
jgi:Flp pilus assembly protein protease CpaA